MDLLTTNRLLAAIPATELEILRPHATLRPLTRREVLYEPRGSIDAVYFPIDGIVSLLTVMKDGVGVETATTGREGMVGMGAFHGVGEAGQQAVIQVPGQCFMVDAEVFRGLLPEMPTLSRLLHRFSVVLFSLAAQNSGCNRKHSIEERCCRWMLMVADRLDQSTFDLTHEFIAQMLGVRRASVTEALGSLEKRGLVSTSRGRITIVDRAGLEACACECYGIIRDKVARLLDTNGTSPK
jgi:CRP-like cAMP-binding protein